MSGDAEVEKVEFSLPDGKTDGEAIAELRLNPILRHATAANALAAATVKYPERLVSAGVAADQLRNMADKVAGGDLRHVSDSLLSQAVMLDATVTELMRRAWQNAGEYLEVFQSYMQLALKAQAQSRTTLEALAKLHQPREQVVRHVHVYEGGQAVVAEEFNHYGEGVRNVEITHQPLGLSPPVPALPSEDPSGHALQGASDARETALLSSRRGKRQRGTEGQPKRAEARAKISGDDRPATAAANSQTTRTKGQ